MRLGQNFLVDPNLLEAIVRDSAIDEHSVVLEVGGGEGVLTRALAERASLVHVVEIDERLRGPLEQAVATASGDVRLHFGDVLRLDLAGLEPPPTAMVANLPYAVATPLIVRSVLELGSIRDWTVMVQLEIAERIAAGPGSRAYASASALCQLACEVRVGRRIDRAVFRPRPRVDSALLHLRRREGTGVPAAGLHALIRASFSHRRKALARSVELAVPSPARQGVRDAVREALVGLGLDASARAEQLAPADFASLYERLDAGAGPAAAALSMLTDRKGGS